LGREVVYVEKGAEFKAKAVDIDENGGLVVIDQNGNKKTLSTGEISVKLM
jgi:biotin-(acetyl-CoA carboxylase) ligase